MTTPPLPAVTALVCTRDRPESIGPTVASILANHHPSFEVIIIDQSAGDATADVLAAARLDPRVRYVHVVPDAAGANVGVARARNMGLELAKADIVASTDDDCVVPAQWLSTMAAILGGNPRIAVAFCNVVAGEHDATAGFIPAYVRTEDYLATSPWQKRHARGMGAGMALRRDAVRHMGGFDEALGPGARFPSCEEGDLALRALLHGYQVFESAQIAVVHFGFRSFNAGRALSRRDWVGIGAAYVKPLKAGHWRALPVFAHEMWLSLMEPLRDGLVYRRRPRGLRRIFSFLNGALRGAAIPVDRSTIRYSGPH